MSRTPSTQSAKMTRGGSFESYFYLSWTPPIGLSIFYSFNIDKASVYAAPLQVKTLAFCFFLLLLER
jgi:hypothetical protein